jgi:hypothetical protein
MKHCYLLAISAIRQSIDRESGPSSVRGIPVALISCGECEQSFSDRAASCPSCGAPNEAVESASRSGEHEFFNQGGVRVTTSLLALSGNRTFAMSGVTSVRMWPRAPKRRLPLALFIVSLILCIGVHGVGGKLFFGLLAIAGLAWAYSLKPTYILSLHTASGETQALADKNRQWISGIVDALNKCIIHRG